MKLKVIAYKYFKVFLVRNKTLEEQLDEAYCCVVFGNSTAGVHSLLRGVPIIALSEGKLYKSVTNTIENIENLDYEVDLTNWKNGLGYSMWQVSELRVRRSMELHPEITYFNWYELISKARKDQSAILILTFAQTKLYNPYTTKGLMKALNINHIPVHLFSTGLLEQKKDKLICNYKTQEPMSYFKNP